MKQLEIEFKTMLTADSYQQLCSYYQLKETQFHTQTNVYFDTADNTLRQLRCGLRIREYETYGEVTLKTPQTVGLLETTETLSLKETQDWIQKQAIPTDGVVAEELHRLSIDPQSLLLLTKLTTKRAEFPIEEGLLALDESWYNEQHDYELELEVSDAVKGRASFDNYLQQHDIPYLPAENKILRATRSS
ncbi:CYTH domain-containing protein [Enterococcus olivae]